MVFGGLVGAIAWNLGTWWFGLPSSSSHALIGGVVGATLVAAGTGAVEGDGIVSKVIVPALVSPIARRPHRRRSASSSSTGSSGASHEERAERQFRWAQVASSSMVALAHGTNDAQKTMGVISLALIANGNISGGDDFDVPTWVVVSCATAIALGTYCGGWRIIKTLGTKVVEVRPPQGFGSEAVAATVILASSHVGFPLSTTQVVSGRRRGLRRRPPGRGGRLGRRPPDRHRLGADAAGRGRDRGRRLRDHRRCSATAARSARSSSASRSSIGCVPALARQPRARRSSRRRRLREPDLRPAPAPSPVPVAA